MSDETGESIAMSSERQADRKGRTLRTVLREHYLAQITCDHEQKLDNAGCACSLVFLGWHPSVGEAVDAWIDHVLTEFPADRDSPEAAEQMTAALNISRRLKAVQGAEWLCEHCRALRAWQQGDQVARYCPECMQPMVPTSPILRAYEQAREREAAANTRLGEIVQHAPAILRALRRAADSVTADEDAQPYRDALAATGWERL